MALCRKILIISVSALAAIAVFFGLAVMLLPRPGSLPSPGIKELPSGSAVNWGAGFTKIAENGRFEMSFDNQTANLELYDKQTGLHWYSTPPGLDDQKGMSGVGRTMASSQLTVDYVNKETKSTFSVQSYVSCVKSKTFAAARIEDGLLVTYSFERKGEGFSIPVIFKLTEKGFDARIDMAHIQEDGNSLVTGICLLPYFGCGLPQDKGFILVPDGSGGIINFQSGQAGRSPYINDVYGRDSVFSSKEKGLLKENIGLPVFGVNNNGGAFVAIIDKSPALARIYAVPGGGDSVLNTANTTFSYRTLDSAVMADATWASKQVVVLPNEPSKQQYAGISYRFTGNSTGDGSLTEMAELCREYEMQAYGLTEMQPQETSLYLEVYGAIKTQKAFAGIVYNTVEPMTTFKEASAILDEGKSLGIDKVVMRYLGVKSGGLDNGPAISSGADGSLGGNGGFRKLAAKAGETGAEIYPDYEFQKMYKSTLTWWSLLYSARSVSGSPAGYERYKLSTLQKDANANSAALMAPGLLGKEADSFVSGFKLSGAAGVSTGSLGNTLYSDFNDRFADRQMSAENTARILAGFDALGGAMVEGINDYAVAASKMAVGVPTSGSAYDVISYEVPFYAMVFGGLKEMASTPLNFAEDIDRAFLMCVEQGISPLLCVTSKGSEAITDTPYAYLYGLHWINQKDRAKRYYREFSSLFSKKSRHITEYLRIDDNLRITTFSDGRSIAVNYSNEEREIDGQKVAARGYAIVDISRPGG